MFDSPIRHYRFPYQRMIRRGTAEQFRRYCSLIKLKHWLHVNEIMIIEIILMTCCTHNFGRKNVKNYTLNLKAQKERNIDQIWYTSTVCKQIKTRQEWVTPISNLRARINFVSTLIKSDDKSWSIFWVYFSCRDPLPGLKSSGDKRHKIYVQRRSFSCSKSNIFKSVGGQVTFVCVD